MSFDFAQDAPLRTKPIVDTDQQQFPLHVFLSLNKKSPMLRDMHRARETGSLRSWFSLDTHVAQLIRIDVRDEQVRASEGEEQEQTDWNGDH